MQALITTLVVTVLAVGGVALAYCLADAVAAEIALRATQNAAPALDIPARVPARATTRLCPSCRTHGVSRPGTICAPCQHGDTTTNGGSQ